MKQTEVNCQGLASTLDPAGNEGAEVGPFSSLLHPIPQQHTCAHLLLRDTLKHLQQMPGSKEGGESYIYYAYVCLKTNS